MKTKQWWWIFHIEVKWTGPLPGGWLQLIVLCCRAHTAYEYLKTTEVVWRLSFFKRLCWEIYLSEYKTISYYICYGGFQERLSEWTASVRPKGFSQFSLSSWKSRSKINKLSSGYENVLRNFLTCEKSPSLNFNQSDSNFQQQQISYQAKQAIAKVLGCECVVIYRRNASHVMVQSLYCNQESVLVLTRAQKHPIK